MEEGDDGEIEDMRGQGLIDEANFDLFMRWVAFGGMQRGLSPVEILEMPPDLCADFLWLVGQYNREMRRARKRKKERE